MERRHRLRRSRDFAHVRARGQTWSNRLMVLSAVDTGLSTSRFGFIASKRIGNAVQRNRTRRLLREAVRHRLDSIPAGWDCVLIARPPLRDATLAQIDQAFFQLLQRARLWTPPAGQHQTATPPDQPNLA